MQMSRANKIILVGLLCITWFYGIILSTTEAEVFHSTPRERLRKRQSPPTTANDVVNNNNAQSKPFVPVFDWEQQEYVKVHNDLRLTLGMPPLQWDPTLAHHAHSWASERWTDCDYRHHSGGPYGESTFWMQYKEFTPEDVVRRWFQEQSFFDHRTNRCKCQPETDGCECGHYTNIIWKSTKRVGCSSPVYCAHVKGLIVVCNYDPPGSRLGVNPLNPPT